MKAVLSDRRFTHAVFGHHELPLVANGVNCQPSDGSSLADTTSRLFYPTVRLLKDKTIHRRVQWKTAPHLLPREAIRYAALDALATRKIALRLRG